MISSRTVTSAAILAAISAHSVKAADIPAIVGTPADVAKCTSIVQATHDEAARRQQDRVLALLGAKKTSESAAAIRAVKAGDWQLQQDVALLDYTNAMSQYANEPRKYPLSDAFAKAVTFSLAAFDPKEITEDCNEDPKGTLQIAEFLSKFGRSGTVSDRDMAVLQKLATRSDDSKTKAAAHVIGGAVRLNQAVRPNNP